MALNATTVLAALSSMNFTADCAASVSWLEAQGSQGSQGSQVSVPVLDPDDPINIAFLRAALPVGFNSLSNQTFSEFYDELTVAKPSIWYNPAVESIQAGCLAPELAKTLSFGELDLTANCSATAVVYGNALCAVNGPKWAGKTALWHVEHFEGSKWIVGNPPTKPLNSSSGLAMLRDSLPSQYSDISDTELATWASTVLEQNGSFINKSQAAQVCETCLVAFCDAAAFTGNPDIAGIGAIVSYLMGASLVTISLLYWMLKTITDHFSGTSSGSRGSFRFSASDTLGALSGGAIALALSLSLALLILLIKDGSSYYEQMMAENATYIAFYILLILGTYFPLSSFKGPEFATTWMSLYYLVACLQIISLLAVILDAIARYGTFAFGDEPCLRSQLGESPINNPVVYSILFLVVGGISRALLIFSFTFKALGKWFQLFVSWTTESPSAALSKKQRRKARVRQFFSDVEAVSLLVAFPLFSTGILFVGGWLIVRLIFSLFTNRPLDKAKLKELRRQHLEGIHCLMDWCFEKASYGSWFLSLLSFPLLWLDVAFILRVRRAMSVIAGSAWIENQVGFGQVLALLLWMPVVVGFTWSLVQKVFDKWLTWLASTASRATDTPSDDTESVELRERRQRLMERRIETYPGSGKKK